MQVVVDPVQIHGSILRPNGAEIFRCKVVFAIEISQLELTGIACFAHASFFSSERPEVSFVERTDVVGALERCADAVLFPAEECVATVRAPVMRLAFAAVIICGSGLAADLAEHLRTEFTVVEVKIAYGCIAALTTALLGRC